MNGSTFTVTIDSLSYGGRGVARKQDGKVVFISGVIPGETVLARVEKQHAAYETAEVVEILEKSPRRVEPECPHFALCGGCDWQHMPYEDQLSWKDAILKAEAARSGHGGDLGHLQPVGSRDAYGYRGHAVLQARGGNLGFFRKKTNEIIVFEDCPVLNTRMREIIRGVREILAPARLPLYTVEIHAPGEDSILQARCGRIDRGRIRPIMEQMHHELGISGISFVSREERRPPAVLGQECCRYSLAVQGRQVTLASAFGEFIQANAWINEQLVSAVAGLTRGAKHVVDLYCGSGNFSIPIAGGAERVTGVEWSRGLVSQGRASAARNKAGNVTFHAMDVRRALTEMKQELSSCDTLVLDPPREGAKEVSALLPDLGASKIIYISCNPTTLARDLKPLLSAGYRRGSLGLFDMFPQTFHIESVTVLEKQPS